MGKKQKFRGLRSPKKVAATRPDFFAAYVRNPQATTPHTQMAGSPNYDDATPLAALQAYFKTFSPQSNRR